MSGRFSLRRVVLALLLCAVGSLAVVGLHTFRRFQPSAITLGPNTTIYFEDDPPLTTRVHEAVHRRQMRDKSLPLRIWTAVVYSFDYGYRLDEEAEAKAGEICLQIHKFSSELPDYTTARSRAQAEAYRAWAWERIGMEVPDRVGRKLGNGDRCQEILHGVSLDLPPGEELSERDALRLATFNFLQSYGSTEVEVSQWKARLELAGYAAPVRGDFGVELPGFGLLAAGREQALPPDSALTDEEGGRALHRLTYYMARRMYSQLQPPLQGYRGRPLMDVDDAGDRLGVPVAEWPRRLVSRTLAGEVDEDGLEWLEAMATHPLHLDFATFARAPRADIVGQRYRLPLPHGSQQLVLSELGPIREAFQAQWGRAALLAAQGDLAGAEELMRTVLAAAVQMVDHAPFEVDVVLAVDMVRHALRSLEELLEAQGREEEVTWRDDVLWLAAWTRGHRTALFSDDPEAIYHAMPAIAADEEIPHAFRRFAYRQVVLFDVCMEHRGDALSRRQHQRWRTSVERALVRRESDAQLLELTRQTVRDLLNASHVEPARICVPRRVVRPQARIAIMTSPPRFPASVFADGEE